MSCGSIWLLVAPDATGIMQHLHCHGPHVYKFAELVVCLNPTSKLLCKSSKMVQHGPRQYSIMLAQVYETEESKVNGSKQSAMSSNLAVINFAPQKQVWRGKVSDVDRTLASQDISFHPDFLYIALTKLFFAWRTFHWQIYSWPEESKQKTAFTMLCHAGKTSMNNDIIVPNHTNTIHESRLLVQAQPHLVEQILNEEWEVLAMVLRIKNEVAKALIILIVQTGSQRNRHGCPCSSTLHTSLNELAGNECIVRTVIIVRTAWGRGAALNLRRNMGLLERSLRISVGRVACNNSFFEGTTMSWVHGHQYPPVEALLGGLFTASSTA